MNGNWCLIESDPGTSSAKHNCIIESALVDLHADCSGNFTIASYLYVAAIANRLQSGSLDNV